MPLSEALGYLLAGYLGLVLFFGSTGVLFWTVLSLFYKPFPAANGFAPSLSIVVPALNEAAIITPFLQNLYRAIAGYPGQVEVIILDDGSQDETVVILTSAQPQFGYRLIVDGAGHRGKLARVAQGFAIATGEIILQIDADALLEEAALAEIVAPLVRSDCHGVYGYMKPRFSRQTGGGVKAFLRAYFAFANLILRRGQSVIGSESLLGGNLSAIRATTLRALWVEIESGKLWQAGRDDNALALHFLAHGKNVVFQQTAVAWSLMPDKVRVVASQHCRFYQDRELKYRMLARIFPSRPWFVLGMAALELFALLLWRPALCGVKKLAGLGKSWREVKEYRWQVS